MIKNIYLFTWKEKYLLDKELSRRTSNFSEKYGKDSVSTYNNENRNEWNIKQNIFWWWLFSTKKLTILKWVPVSTDKQNGFTTDMLENFTEYLINNWDKIPQDNLLVLVSYNPDKRWKLYKFLQNECNTKNFDTLKSIELKNFIKNTFWEIKISDQTMEFFIEKVWTDLYRISSEIDKLVEYCNVHDIKEINENLINNIIFWLTETVAFWFMELLLKDKFKAIKYLDQIQQEWTNRNEFAWALYYQLKTNIMLDDYYKKWIKDQKQIAAECGLSPQAIFINMKNIKQISKNWNELKNMYKWLIWIDIWIKSGKNKDNEFRLNIKKLWLQFKE